MAPKGTAHARFARAIERGNLVLAETAAREMGRLALGDALALTGLYARASEARRFEPAAVRWHGRFSTELAPTINDAALALSALMALPTASAEAGAYTLLEVTRRYMTVRVQASVAIFWAGAKSLTRAGAWSFLGARFAATFRSACRLLAPKVVRVGDTRQKGRSGR